MHSQNPSSNPQGKSDMQWITDPAAWMGSGTVRPEREAPVLLERSMSNGRAREARA
jgi:hypothetical protein